jgi:hypothetical protein
MHMKFTEAALDMVSLPVSPIGPLSLRMPGL